MRYRCPLCLKPLERDDQLWKFCPQHRDANREPLNPYEPDEDEGGFFCAERGCDAHGRFQPDGLLYRHHDCSLETGPGTYQPLWNPFWTPSSAPVTDWVTVRRDKIEVGQQVHHWELHALRQAHAAGAHEMWFPAGLLVAEGEPPHALISFSGAKGVGKTYLAMRLLDSNAYNNVADRPVEEFLYLYSHPAQLPAEAEGVQAGAALAAAAPTSAEFLQTLYLREMLRNSDPGHFEEALNSTVSRPRNLKAAMFPARKPEEKRERKRFAFSRSALQYANAIAERLTIRGDAPHWPYRGLIVYDLAGEAVEEGHIDVRRHDEAMDILTVLVSAEHLANGPAGTHALAVAADRINHARDVKARRRELRCCLIVTKCDLWPGRPTLNRTSLLNSLRALTSCRPAASLEREVACAGRSKATLDKVFFTWRESKSASLEVVHGLDDFAQWCLR